MSFIYFKVNYKEINEQNYKSKSIENIYFKIIQNIDQHYLDKKDNEFFINLMDIQENKILVRINHTFDFFCCHSSEDCDEVLDIINFSDLKKYETEKKNNYSEDFYFLEYLLNYENNICIGTGYKYYFENNSIPYESNIYSFNFLMKEYDYDSEIIKKPWQTDIDFERQVKFYDEIKIKYKDYHLKIEQQLIQKKKINEDLVFENLIKNRYQDNSNEILSFCSKFENKTDVFINKQDIENEINMLCKNHIDYL
jgi:hypothetical protein